MAVQLKAIRSCVDADNRSVCSGLNARRFASACVPHNISDLVAARPAPFGAGQFLALDENLELVFLWGQRPFRLQFLANSNV